MKKTTFLLTGTLIFCGVSLNVFAQKTGEPAVNIKSKAPVIVTENDKRVELVNLYAKVVHIPPGGFKPNPQALHALLPDLVITDVSHLDKVINLEHKWFVKVANKGNADAAACTLKFVYGDNWEVVQEKDYDVPALGAGKSAQVYFSPPSVKVKWWMFGVNTDGKVQESNMSNNGYIIEMK